MTRAVVAAVAVLAASPALARVAAPMPAPSPEASPLSAVRSQIESFAGKHGVLLEAFDHPLVTVGDEHDGWVRVDAILMRARGKESGKVRAIRVRLQGRKEDEEGNDAFLALDEIDDVLSATELMTKTAGGDRPQELDHMFFATEDGLIVGFDYGESVTRPFVSWHDEKIHLPSDALAQIRDALKTGRDYLRAQ